MPLSPSGVYTLPSGYLAVTGQDILPSQHNPPLEDIGSVLSEAFYRTGVAPMLANLNMNTFKMVGLADGTAPNDAVNVSQLSGISPRGDIFGLTLSNGTDVTNDINISSGNTASDSNPASSMVLGSAFTKKLDAIWSEGTNSGGRDTGAISDGYWHVFLIKNPTSQVVDVLMSLSPSAPTMPSGYTLKRRLGAVFRLGGSIGLFTQNGNIFKCEDNVIVNRTTALASTLTYMGVPTGIVTQPILSLSLAVTSSSSAAGGIGDAAKGTADTAVISAATATNAFVASQFISGGFLTDTSGRLYLNMNITAGSVLQYLVTLKGWIDTRGQ